MTEVVTGELIYDIKQAPEVLRGYRDLAVAAPPGLSPGIGFASTPDGPVLYVLVYYYGDAAGAKSAVDPLRSLGSPLEDTTRSMSYMEGQASIARPSGGRPVMVRGGRMPELSEEIVDTIVEFATNSPRDFFIDLFFNMVKKFGVGFA